MALAIEVRDLRVSYSKPWRREVSVAVDGLSLSVPRGEVVGFIGPNGAGKSSTIKALMGFLRPDAGEARLLGLPAGDPDARQHVGFLPEVALYYPWLTPLETLEMYGALANLPAADVRRQAKELLERLGIASRAHDRLLSFSKGTLQRVGIAQALLGQPQLLVLDEVSSGLDPIGRHDLRALLRERKDAGVTIFFSSHELTEVAQLCDRLVLVNRGRVQEERRVPELLLSLRRFWVRFEDGETPPIPARRDHGRWLAEFSDVQAWRGALAELERQDVRWLDAGEREGAIEEYFIASIREATRGAAACAD